MGKLTKLFYYIEGQADPKAKLNQPDLAFDVAGSSGAGEDFFWGGVIFCLISGHNMAIKKAASDP